MEHLVKVRPAGCNIRRRVGRLDKDQQTVKKNGKPVNKKFVQFFQVIIGYFGDKSNWPGINNRFFMTYPTPNPRSLLAPLNSSKKTSVANITGDPWPPFPETCSKTLLWAVFSRKGLHRVNFWWHVLLVYCTRATETCGSFRPGRPILQNPHVRSANRTILSCELLFQRFHS